MNWSRLAPKSPKARLYLVQLGSVYLQLADRHTSEHVFNEAVSPEKF